MRPEASCVVRTTVSLALGWTLLAPTPMHAQSTALQPDGTWQTRAWIGDVVFLSATTLLGALTAGVVRKLGHGSFQDGFARGALGGVVAYGGRRLAAADFWGAGLLGREVSATGASMVRNAGEGRPMLSRLTLPLGPVGVQLRQGADAGVQLKLDANTTVWFLSSLADHRLKLDAGASLSAGTPVFRAPGRRPVSEDSVASGVALGGVIVLAGDADRYPGSDVFAHERVHVLQHDFGQEIWGDPLETWLGRRLPGGRTVVRWVRPAVLYPALQASFQKVLHLSWEERPWEMEAEYLANR